MGRAQEAERESVVRAQMAEEELSSFKQSVAEKEEKEQHADAQTQVVQRTSTSGPTWMKSGEVAEQLRMAAQSIEVSQDSNEDTLATTCTEIADTLVALQVMESRLCEPRSRPVGQEFVVLSKMVGDQSNILQNAGIALQNALQSAKELWQSRRSVAQAMEAAMDANDQLVDKEMILRDALRQVAEQRATLEGMGRAYVELEDAVSIANRGLMDRHEAYGRAVASGDEERKFLQSLTTTIAERDESLQALHQQLRVTLLQKEQVSHAADASIAQREEQLAMARLAIQGGGDAWQAASDSRKFANAESIRKVEAMLGPEGSVPGIDLPPEVELTALSKDELVAELKVKRKALEETQGMLASAGMLLMDKEDELAGLYEVANRAVADSLRGMRRSSQLHAETQAKRV